MVGMFGHPNTLDACAVQRQALTVLVLWSGYLPAGRREGRKDDPQELCLTSTDVLVKQPWKDGAPYLDV